MSLILALFAALPASAAEVVWLGPTPSAEQAARVAVLAKATRPGIALDDLPGQADHWNDARDGARLEAIDQALNDVRAFEQRLDGELLIMRDLAEPLAEITVLRDEQDRGRLYAALAYQGFAVDRFFEDRLSSDNRAGPYRSQVGERFVPVPWRDAVAIEPDRAISAYEIAEAPQRVHYEEVRAHLGGVLPGTLAFADPGADLALVLDGRRLDDAGTIRVAPGRHFAHLLMGDRIVSRWSGTIAAGARVDVPLVPPDIDAARSWANTLPAAAPDALADDLAALGDTVWLVDPEGKGQVFEWTAGTGIRPIDVDLRGAAATGSPDSLQPTVAVSLGGGWLASDDFYLQDPVSTEPSFGTVNAAGLVMSATGGVDLGRWRFEAGTDIWWTPGAPHVARWKDNQTHFRAFPHVAAGIPEARLAIGWLTPHHLGLGPRLALPLGPVEVVGNGTLGLAITPDDENGTWEGAPVFSAWAGVGARFGKKDTAED